jgi:flagellar biosynthesis chaperone FliJ
MHRTTLERRLSDAHDRLVAETPLASKEHDEANRHATVMLQNRAALAEQIDELERRRNELLDQLVVDPG